MFLLEILRRKPDFTKKNGDVVVDLLRKVFNMPRISQSTPYIVPLDFVMRPDLVSNSIYGDQNQFDSLLKFNAISNPFSINAGDIIYAPPLEALKSSVAIGTQIVDKSSVINAQKTLTPKTIQDSKRLSQIRVPAAPTNVNTPSDTNVKVSGGQIIFGEDVTSVTATKCQDTVSRAKLKETLLANKIFST